jgi:predicted O-methyltransferase YrrM
MKWDRQDQAVALKTANFPPWREDWEEFLTDFGIDVIKMHGRESHTRLRETMEIIKKYAAGEEILYEHFNDFIEEKNMVDKPINIWRNKIKNCKFDCWDCGYCDKIIKAKYGNNLNEKVDFVVQALVDAVNKHVHIHHIPGLTSQRVQSLLNVLASKSTTYLEIGSYLGATSSSALMDNTLNAYFVDLWEEDIQPAEANIQLPPNSRSQFEANIEPYVGDSAIHVIQDDMLAVDTSQIKNVDLFFYDGPHEYADVYKALMHYKDVFATQAVLVMDDANWTDTVLATDAALKDAGLKVMFTKKVLNAVESSKDWWNGLYIVVINKGK